MVSLMPKKFEVKSFMPMESLTKKRQISFQLNDAVTGQGKWCLLEAFFIQKYCWFLTERWKYHQKIDDENEAAWLRKIFADGQVDGTEKSSVGKARAEARVSTKFSSYAIK